MLDSTAREHFLTKRVLLVFLLVTAALLTGGGTANAANSVFNVTGWIPTSALTKCKATTPQGDPWKITITATYNSFNGYVSEHASFQKPSSTCAERYTSTRVSITDKANLGSTISSAGATSASQSVYYGAIPPIDADGSQRPHR